MSKQTLHYPCGRIIERDYASRHGLKLNNQRPTLIELWEASPELIRDCELAVHPFEGKVVTYKRYKWYPEDWICQFGNGTIAISKERDETNV